MGVQKRHWIRRSFKWLRIVRYEYKNGNYLNETARSITKDLLIRTSFVAFVR
jgi:hypothetical protein